MPRRPRGAGARLHETPLWPPGMPGLTLPPNDSPSPRRRGVTGRRSSTRARATASGTSRSRDRPRRSTTSTSTSASSTSRAVDGQELHDHAATGRSSRSRRAARLTAGRSPCASTTRARRPSSPTPTARSRAGSRPTTARSWSTSRRAPRPGSRSTTTRATRRPTTSRSRCPQGITALANGVLVSSASSGGKTTWRWRETDPMASYLATATNGEVRPRPADGPERPADLQRGRQRSELRSARRPRSRCCSQGARDRRVLQRPLRRLPVQCGRRDHRSGARRRLLAGDPDQAQLRLCAGRADGRPRALAHVVRRRGHAHRVAGHLDPRGLRDVLGVDLDRAPRRPDGAAGVRRALRGASSSRGAPRRRALAAAVAAVLHPGLRPRRHDAAGAAREGRRLHVLPDPARLVRRRTATAT